MMNPSFGPLWLFIAMRYVRGTDLKALIEVEGTLAAGRTASIVSQVASALDAAHEQGLIHRDVKPANILLAPSGDTRPDKVYLSDFGLTKRASSDSGLTATGQFVGTLDYAAPEQFEGGVLTPQTDVYSLGCVVYECLTGEVPFPRDREAAVLHAHLMEPPPRVTDRRPGLPAGLDAVVARAMAKRPQDRFPTAGDLAAALDAEVGAIVVEQHEPRPGRRRWAILTAAAILAVIVLGTAVALLRNGTAPRTTGQGSAPPSGSPSPSAIAEVTSSPIAADPNSVLRIDPATNAVSADVGVGVQPQYVAFSGGLLWVVNVADHTISRIDPRTNEVIGTSARRLQTSTQ